MRIAEGPAGRPGDLRAAVERVLTERTVTPVYQPIVDLGDRTVMAVEALARGPAGSELERPDQLFEAARRYGWLGEMDMLCTERAMECALEASVSPPVVFVNAEPATLDRPMSPRLKQLVMSGLPYRTILEYTERGLPTAPGAMLNLAGAVEACGGGIALDDVGADPMSLAFLPVIEPEVIKLDMHLVHNPDTALTQETCRVVREAARRTGAVIIAEGIETEADLHTARSLGAHWGQGWLFGRPGPLDAVTFTDPPAGVTTLRAPQRGLHQPGGVPFEIAAAHGTRQTGDLDTVVQTLARACGTVGPHDAAVVVASGDSPQIAARLARLLEGVTSPSAYVTTISSASDRVDGEAVLAVVGTDGARAVCVRAGEPGGDLEFVVTGELSATVTISRVLLQRLPIRRTGHPVSYSAMANAATQPPQRRTGGHGKAAA